MAEWVKREYGKGAIDRAGTVLVPWWSGGDGPKDLGQLYMIVHNWRTSHGLPLNAFVVGLRQRVKRVEGNVIVAQRLKRFTALMNKLVREPSMKLSQMQDLGGCRAIVSNVAAVDTLYEMYRGGEGLFTSEGNLKCYDYIRYPKSDGYRGVHVVGRYAARAITREPWNGHRIEIQLRSQLQHAFATTVETVTTFTGTPLKFGAGPTEWRRFFSLMGSTLALREGTQLVEGTPHDEDELIRELSDAAKALRVPQRLRGWTNALQTLPSQSTRKAFKWLLLVLDTTKNTINVTGYATTAEASQKIAEIERLRRKDLDAVLVYVASINQLQVAYPNYYADTGEFLNALDVALARK